MSASAQDSEVALKYASASAPFIAAGRSISASNSARDGPLRLCALLQTFWSQSHHAMHARHCQRFGTPPSATRILSGSASSAGGVHPSEMSQATVFGPGCSSTSALTVTLNSAIVVLLLCNVTNNPALSVASGVANGD